MLFVSASRVAVREYWFDRLLDAYDVSNPPKHVYHCFGVPLLAYARSWLARPLAAALVTQLWDVFDWADVSQLERVQGARRQSGEAAGGGNVCV